MWIGTRLQARTRHGFLTLRGVALRRAMGLERDFNCTHLVWFARGGPVQKATLRLLHVVVVHEVEDQRDREAVQAVTVLTDGHLGCCRALGPSKGEDDRGF